VIDREQKINLPMSRDLAWNALIPDRPRSATRRVVFHQSKRALPGPRPEQLALIEMTFRVMAAKWKFFSQNLDGAGFCEESCRNSVEWKQKWERII